MSRGGLNRIEIDLRQDKNERAKDRRKRELIRMAYRHTGKLRQKPSQN